MKSTVLLLFVLGVGLAACGGESSPHEPSAVLVLRATLADPDRGVRYAAVEALGKAGAGPAALAPALADDAWCVRREAGWWLARAGADALPVLEVALTHASPGVRATAARALGGLHAVGIPALRRALGDPELEVRCEALVAVRRIGAEHASGLASVVKHHLFAADPDEQVQAALALVAIAPESADAAATILTRELRHGKFLDHYEAIDALLAAGEAGREALRVIESELPEHDADRARIRWSREAWEAKRLGAEDPASSPEPLPTLETLPPRVAPPAPATPSLLAGLADAERDTRIRAANALGRLEAWPEGVEAALRRALADANWRVRRAAVVALGAHGRAPEGIAPFLADPILPLSYAAADAIARGGEAAALPTAEQVATGHYGVLHYAPLVFAELGETGAPAVETLRGLLAHADVNVRECAARCLCEIGRPAAPAAPELLEALADDRLCVVSHAALALGSLGDIDVLLPSLLHESARVRAYGAFAIGWVLGAQRAVDQVRYEPRLPVEAVDAPDGYAANALWSPEFPAALADARKRKYTELDPVEAERAMELLLPEGQRTGCGVDFEELRSTIGSSELPAFVHYATRARRTSPKRLYLYSPLHRMARWDHIPALLWFRRNEAPDVLSGFSELEMPLEYSAQYPRQRAVDYLDADPGPDEDDILRAFLHRLVEKPDDGIGQPEQWLLNRFEPDDQDAPLLLAAAKALAPDEPTHDPRRPYYAALRALGGLRDEASEAYLQTVSTELGDEALVALSALARRGDDGAAGELNERSYEATGALFLLLEARPEWRTALLVAHLRDRDTAHALLDERSSWMGTLQWLGVPVSEAFFLGVEPALAAEPPPPDVLARVVVDMPLCNTKRLARLLFAVAEETDLPPWWDEEEGDSIVGGVPYRTSAFLYAADPDRLLALMRTWAECDDEDVCEWARMGLILLGDAESLPLVMEWLRDAEVDFSAGILARIDDPVVRHMLARGSQNESFSEWDRHQSLNALANLEGWPRYLPAEVLDYTPEAAFDTVADAIRAGDIESVLTLSYWPRMLADFRAHPEIVAVCRRVAILALAGDDAARAAAWSAWRAARYRWVHHEINFEEQTLGADPSTLPHWCADLDSNCCRVSDGLAAYVFEGPFEVSDLWGSEKHGVGQELSRHARLDLDLRGGRWRLAPLLDEIAPMGRISVFVPQPE